MEAPSVDEETLVWRGSPSQWLNFGFYFACLLLGAAVVAAWWFYRDQSPLILAVLAVPVVMALWRGMATACRRYEVTTQRVRMTTGVLSRKTNELELYRVRDYTVLRPFWLRMVGRGHVILQTSDRSTPEVVLEAVPRPEQLKDDVRTNTEIVRRRRGVRDFEIDTA